MKCGTRFRTRHLKWRHVAGAIVLLIAVASTSDVIAIPQAGAATSSIEERPAAVSPITSSVAQQAPAQATAPIAPLSEPDHVAQIAALYQDLAEHQAATSQEAIASSRQSAESLSNLITVVLAIGASIGGLLTWYGVTSGRALRNLLEKSTKAANAARSSIEASLSEVKTIVAAIGETRTQAESARDELDEALSAIRLTSLECVYAATDASIDTLLSLDDDVKSAGNSSAGSEDRKLQGLKLRRTEAANRLERRLTALEQANEQVKAIDELEYSRTLSYIAANRAVLHGCRGELGLAFDQAVVAAKSNPMDHPDREWNCTQYASMLAQEGEMPLTAALEWARRTAMKDASLLGEMTKDADFAFLTATPEFQALRDDFKI